MEGWKPKVMHTLVSLKYSFYIFILQRFSLELNTHTHAHRKKENGKNFQLTRQCRKIFPERDHS